MQCHAWWKGACVLGGAGYHNNALDSLVPRPSQLFNVSACNTENLGIRLAFGSPTIQIKEIISSRTNIKYARQEHWECMQLSPVMQEHSC